jgi:putative protease
MRVVARLKNFMEIEKLINLGVDVFLVDTPLAVKQINGELFSDLDKIITYEKEVYLLINKMIHETDLEMLEMILNKANNDKITGIVCGDMTVMVMAKKLGLENKIIYQPGTMNTSSFDNEYFHRKAIKGITISKEITLEEITNIFKNKVTEISLIGHGYLDMFYSKRGLLSNYFIYKGVDYNNIKNNDKFRLKEEMRPDSLYPIFEDDGGTHIFRDKALESFNELDVLKQYLDDFFVERIFIDDQEYYDSLLAYKTSTYMNEFLDKYKDKYNKGFYYQYTEKIKGELNEN